MNLRDEVVRALVAAALDDRILIMKVETGATDDDLTVTAHPDTHPTLEQVGSVKVVRSVHVPPGEFYIMNMAAIRDITFDTRSDSVEVEDTDGFD